MDYVNPSELIDEMLRAAKRKAQLGVQDMLLRGALAGFVPEFRPRWPSAKFKRRVCRRSWASLLFPVDL